jgi:hypothetical protein
MSKEWAKVQEAMPPQKLQTQRFVMKIIFGFLGISLQIPTW